MASTQIVSQQIRDDTIVNADINSAAAIAITKIAQGTANQLIGSNAGATANEYKTLSGTANEITVTQGVGTITLSTPQAIGSTSTPTFASETLTATTNQLVLGTTNTTTISSTAPSASRIYTIPDTGTNSSFVMTDGNQTINGLKTFTQDITVTNALAPGTPASASQISTGDPNTKALILKGNIYTPSQSGVTPDSVANLVMWYKAQSLIGTYTDGQAVVSWPDSSGGGYTLTAVNSPLFYTTTHTIGGLPVVSFINGNTSFTVSGPSINTQNSTVIMVYTDLNGGGNLNWFNNTSGSEGFYTGGSTSNIKFIHSSASAGVTSFSAQPSGTPTVMGICWSATSAFVNRDGPTTAQSFAAIPSFSYNVGAIGRAASGQLGIYLAEMAVYNRALTQTEINAVTVGLTTKYGIAYSGSISQIVNLEENQSPAGAALSAIDGLGRYVQATSAGTPSDNPVIGTTVYDTTNHQLDIYDGGWKGIIENALPLTGGTLTGALTITNASIKNNAAQTTVSGSAGTAKYSQPEQGTTYKVVIIYLAGYTNSGTQNYTYPTAFVNTPVAIYTTAGATPTIGLTTVSIASTTTTGFVILEGY